MNISILGAGAWGTAMAVLLDQAGHRITLVPRRIEHAFDLAEKRENIDYLPGIPFSDSLQIGFEIAPTLFEAQAIILACPAKGLETLVKQVSQSLEGAHELKWAVTLCKGLVDEGLKLPTDYVKEALPQLNCAMLTGPTYAREVAEGKPTAMVLASEQSGESLEQLQAALCTPSLRIYSSNDLKGVELGAALKNVYAIALGVCAGLGLGDNSSAALITRSLNEMVQVGTTLGGQRHTFYGLSGIGDLVATCSGEWSRNRSFGYALGQGKTVPQLMEGRRTVVEGYRASAALQKLCNQVGIEAPILNEVVDVLYHHKPPVDALKSLMSRTLKSEIG